MPAVIEVAFVAESPPKLDSGRYFYFEQVRKGDSLFWETMKTLYPNDYPQSGPPRDRKREFLERFRGDGFYLLDAVDEPLGDVTAARKRHHIRLSLPRLCGDLRSVCAAGVKVVLISATVYDVCAASLKVEGFNVINNEMIDFPGTGGQRKFRGKLKDTLQQNGVHVG
jgi:hypothetical protein